jgi:hypothetical protein
MNQLDFNWGKLIAKLQQQFGKKPDMEAVLFLVGIRELGKLKNDFSKEEKQNLVHIATCKILSYEDYYQLEFLDQDGWPHWKVVKPLPNLNLQQQENLLKENLIRYFDEMDYFDEKN